MMTRAGIRCVDRDCDALRILILNGDLPVFPGRAGHEYLHTTRLARLAQKVGLVSLVHTREQDEKKKGLADAGVALYVWEAPCLGQGPSSNGVRPSGGLVGPDPGRARSGRDMARRPLIRRGGKTAYDMLRAWPRRPRDTVVQDLTFRNISGPVLRALDDEGWQALIVIQSNCAPWLDYLPRFPTSVLVLHDIRALGYERRARATEHLRERIACRLEARRYRSFEREYCRKYDLVVTVSSADEAWVRQHYRPARLMTIPIPVDADYFTPMTEIRALDANIVFTGMMNHPPNADAACFFAQQVFPRVRAAIPEAEFWIVGRDPPPQVAALADLPGVVLTGFVSDIRPYIARSTVVVVPLRFGSGMRNKILEAWAMEKCVISTRIGAEGLEYQDGVNILVADDAPTMADKVIQAIRDPRVREPIRAQGRHLITEHHHPDRLVSRYYRAIASVVREKRQRADPMRAVIDLRWMRPGVAGGIENLSRSFVKQLLSLDAFNRYTVLVPAQVRYDFDLRSRPNVKVTACDGPGHYSRRLLDQGLRSLHHRLKVDYWRSPEVDALRRAHTLDAEVALSVPGYINPDFAPLKNVLIVPDIQHEYCPELFSAEALDERRRVYTNSIRQADHLCAISEFTRQTLIERLGVPPERVTTTHLAADPLFHPESAYRGRPQRVLKRFGLEAGEYLLLPGHTWPHKNHRTAFEALRIVRDAHRLEPLLVCTGNPREAHADLLTTIRDLGLGDRVRFLGYCSASEMPALYEGAAGLVFPSLFEGFGLPLLEAMWCDCPIACSDSTSLPEVAGDAALLVDPRSPEHLADAISRLLTDGTLRRELIERGRRQRAKFSWANFTMDVVRVMHQVQERQFG
jgi:glycosyltransferase involved in cell wall biosynthesis